MEQCLENLSNCYQGCEEEISELVYQINKMLNEKKSEWESSYNELLQNNKIMAKDLSLYKIEVEDKDAEILDLRKELTIIDKSNYEKRMGLESKICELSHTVSELKSQLKSNPKINSSCDNSLEFAVSALKKECDYYQDKIAELEVVQTTHVAQIKLLEEQRSHILKKNEELKQKFSKCRKEYHSKLNATDCELDVLAKQKDKYESSIEELKLIISNKDSEIDNVKGTLEDLLSSNHKNNTLFSNMQKNFDSLTQEKDVLMEKFESISMKNQELQNQNDSLISKLEILEQNAEQSSYGAKNEVSMLKTQLEIYLKENDFLRTFLLQKDHSGSKKHFQYLEKLEADNNSLKENIANMEEEIANLLKLSEQNSRAVGTLSSPSEVKQVKERYDRHLQNMKAEVEQLTLENLSLKAMHQHCDHSVISELDSNGNSVVLSSHGHGETDLNKSGSILSEVPALKFPETPSIKSVTVDSPGKRNLDKCSSINSPLTKEFKDLQENILKAFEAKLNQCVSNFQTGTQPM